MRYSIIMPIYDPEGKNDNLTARSLLSVLKNSIGKEIEIIPVFHKDLNYSTAVNVGLSRAKGDYLVILSNDVEILDPEWLDKFYKPDGISAYRSIEFFITRKQVPDACVWGMPRNVFEKIGYLDEIFKDGYGFEDDDYWMRAESLNIPFYYVGAKVIHHQNRTYQMYFSPLKEEMTTRNEVLFRAKYPNI